MTEEPQIGDDENVIDILHEIFDRSDWVPYASGDITMSIHHLTTAAMAERAAASPNLFAAALLHDFGHYGVDYRTNCMKAEQAHQLDPDLDVEHPGIGAQVLSAFFGPEVKNVGAPS